MLSLALLLFAKAADSLAVPGVSRALAEYRAARMDSVRYDLSLDLREADSARGRVTVRFRRRGTGDAILDFRGPSLGQPTVNGARVTAAQWQNGHLRIPASALRTGENAVELTFTSLIAPAGASIIRYRDATDGATYLYTLLVPSDANALFPCFDQPDIKARLRLTLVTPPGWRTLGNAPQAGRDSAAGGVTHQFAVSDRMSTYLMAFAAGPWAVRGATVDGRRISMYVRASRAAEAEADTLIAMNARALRWLERYTARDFPFQKYDFLLAPAFPFGGMEHPGAVFYNEDRFIYREPPTINQLRGREATTYHEVAHQWFGDLVTMRWFDDLWLKEGFATYVSAIMQHDLAPAADTWRTFFLANKPVAYGTDATKGTTPVWQSLANLDQAKSNYGPIVYNKAPGILKQLNYLVGDTAFRDGLRGYVARHAYGNATWRDLLGAIGGAARMRLDAWGANYILRPGLPRLTQRVIPRTGGWTLELVQQSLEPQPIGTPWPVRTRVQVRHGGKDTFRDVVISAMRTTVAFTGPLPDMVFANDGDRAYALVSPDTGSVRWLESHIGEIADPLRRAMLWSALWDEVRDARLSPARFITAALRAVPAERDDQIAPFIVSRLVRASEGYLCDADLTATLPALERALMQGAQDTTRSYSVRKAQLDALVGVARSPGALRHLDAALDSTTLLGHPLRAPTRWALVNALAARGATGARTRLAAESQRDSTSDGRRRAFIAGAAFPDAATKAEYWRRYFNDPSLNEDWVSASLSTFHDPSHQALTARYLRPALDTLPWVQQSRRIFFLGAWLQATMNGQRTATAAAEVQRYLSDNPRLPLDLRQKVLQSVDELERTVRIRSVCP